MNHDIKHNIKQQSSWKRGLYMLLFAVFYQIAEIILFMIVIFQFIVKLLTGDTNPQLRQLGQTLGMYIYQIVQFLSFNSEQHPYPFSEWPVSENNEINQPSSEKAEVDGALKKIEQGDAGGE